MPEILSRAVFSRTNAHSQARCDTIIPGGTGPTQVDGLSAAGYSILY